MWLTPAVFSLRRLAYLSISWSSWSISIPPLQDLVLEGINKADFFCNFHFFWSPCTLSHSEFCSSPSTSLCHSGILSPLIHSVPKPVLVSLPVLQQIIPIAAPGLLDYMRRLEKCTVHSLVGKAAPQLKQNIHKWNHYFWLAWWCFSRSLLKYWLGSKSCFSFSFLGCTCTYSCVSA